MKSIVENGFVKAPAIRNGSVIDHIPTRHLPEVISLLDLFEYEYPVTIGLNYGSSCLGRKGLIKIEEKFFTPEEVNRLALVCRDVVINVIRDYKVVDKIRVELPDTVAGTLLCPNPKCITNHEPMEGRYTVLDKKEVVLQCDYCTRKLYKGDLKLISLSKH